MTQYEKHLSHKHSSLGRRLSLNASVRKAALQQVQSTWHTTNCPPPATISTACNSSCCCSAVIPAYPAPYRRIHALHFCYNLLQQGML
jgi:hypothetical protein